MIIYIMTTEERYAEVCRIRNEVKRLGLEGMDDVLIMPIDSLCAAYNGTGPEFLPEDIRQSLDDICKPFLPAVMVHDVDFSYSTGRQKAFVEANNRLLKNCIICANDAYPFYHWKRYALYAESYAIYRACCKFGWIAWLSAYNETQKRNKEMNP